MEVSPLREGDEVFREGLELLDNAGSDFDFAVDDEARDDIAEHRLVLRGGISRLETNTGFAVNVLSSLCCHVYSPM